MSKQYTAGLVLVILVGLAFGTVWSGCSSSKETEQMSAPQRFSYAKSLFAEKNYLDAYEEFRIVTLQFQGSSFADSAQFDMGECRFYREEYLLAAYEYDVLARTMPSSKFVPEARYRRALCYYKLSPPYYLDQTYTHQAIDEFQSFIEYHPTDSLVTDAEAKISELNTKLARKEYENGETYIHMEYYKSAIASFDHVLEKYHDSPYAEQAQLKKAELLMMRNRPAEAKVEIEKFFAKYPNSQLMGEARKTEEDAIAGMAKQSSKGKLAPANPLQPDSSRKE